VRRISWSSLDAYWAYDYLGIKITTWKTQGEMGRRKNIKRTGWEKTFGRGSKKVKVGGDK